MMILKAFLLALLLGFKSAAALTWTDSAYCGVYPDPHFTGKSPISCCPESAIGTHALVFISLRCIGANE